jgi:hypothetical protein
MVTFKNSYDPPKQVYGYAPVPPDTGEIVYTFYLVNYFPSNNGYNMSYDFSGVLEAIGKDYQWIQGAQSGVVTPGLYNVASFYLTNGSGNQTIQKGSVPLITIAGTTIDFWFWSGGSTPHINLLTPSGFTEPTNSSTDNVIACSAYTVSLNGGENSPTTNNIFISLNPDPLWNWIGYYGTTTYSEWSQPPVLTIQGNNTGSLEVIFENIVINNWSFDASNNQLTWTTSGGNGSAASLTFSVVTAHSPNAYSGLSFTGTLQTDPNGSGGFSQSGTFSGQIAETSTDQSAQSFLQFLLENSSIAQQFNTELETLATNAQTQQQNGATSTEIINTANQNLTSWFQQQGYDTTPQALYQALLQFGYTDLLFWLGVYGLTEVVPQGNITQNTAPVLAIVLDSNNQAIPQLCGVTLENYTFNNGVLSWPMTGGNTTAGQVQFYYTSPISLSSTQPTGYTGPWFQGTITVSYQGETQTLTYYGEIGNPVSFPLKNWTGFYGVTSYSPWAQPPSLTIQCDPSGTLQILLDGVVINNWSYNAVYNQLTWTSNGGNNSAATLTFDQATANSQNSYSGPTFTGKLQTNLNSSGSFTQSGTFAGELSQPQDLSEWIGSYGVTVLTPSSSSSNSNSNPIMGPELDVSMSGNTPQVSLNFGNNNTTTTIPTSNFNQATNTLTWTGSMPINTSGTVQFGTQTAPTSSSSYIGNYFDGTLTLNEKVTFFQAGTYSFSGQMGEFYYANSTIPTTWQVILGDIKKVTVLIIRMYLQNKAMEVGEAFTEWVFEVISEIFSSEETAVTALASEGIEVADITDYATGIFTNVGTPINFSKPPELIEPSDPGTTNAGDAGDAADAAADAADVDADAAGLAVDADAAVDVGADVALDAGADVALDCLWLLFL